jgi:hypothetical protein
MKNIVMAAVVATALTTGAANAGEMLFNGSLEYQVEAEKIELNFGSDYVVGDFTVSPVLTAFHTDADKFDFEGADLTVSYSLNATSSLYVTVETDANLEYEEATVGMSFAF